MTGQAHKKLIEVALPLDEINAACKADKDRNIGTLRNVHKWFAPMPLPAWRALLYAALVDDAGNDERRAYHLDLIKRLVATGGEAPDAQTIAEARQNVSDQFGGEVPPVLDPFCGGGTTLIEAQRLGMPAFGSDLNPVPVLVTRTITELLPKVRGLQPRHPEPAGAPKRAGAGARALPQPALIDSVTSRAYTGYDGLFRDVNFYAERLRADAWERLKAHFPDTVGETVVAWLWARTALCPNPTCGVETVLASSWWLSKKPGDLCWIQPSVVDSQVRLDIATGQREASAPPSPKLGRGAAFSCLGCASVVTEEAVAEQGTTSGLGLRMTCVVTERNGARVYRAPTAAEIAAATDVGPVEDFPDLRLPDIPRWFSGPRFGLRTQRDLYTPRQLATLATFADLVAETHAQVLQDGGSAEWASAVVTLLGLAVGKMTQVNSSQAMIEVCSGPTRFHSGFGRNDLPMTWDFFEPNVFQDAGANWLRVVGTMLSGVKLIGDTGPAVVTRGDARVAALPTQGLVATDPPYFDAIGYADLSDYFYVWHRRALRAVHPDLFTTAAAPKQGELTAVPSHHGNSASAARTYFIDGFTETFRNLQQSMRADLPLLIVYASKEQKGGREEETRWSSILTAIVEADLEITGTWPIHGTGSRRMIGMGTNSIATYVVMVCRPRPATAGTAALGDFNRALRRELRPAVHDFQAAGILPVDLAQAAMGPGMQVYSRYKAVLDQSGTRVPVEQALRLINAALGEVLDEQEGELDPYSRFTVSWWEKHGWQAAPFGEADQLARPQGLSVDDLVRAGVVHHPTPGFVAALGSGELDRTWKPTTDSRPSAWEAVHHLADRLIDGGGASDAARLLGDLGTFRDPAQGLVYRLHDIAARKGRVKDQERYNALIGSWSDLLGLSATEKDGLF